jgi:hypothetical protein
VSENLIDAADTDALAAEYVLGTLDPDERTAAQRLLAEDPAFATKVKVWERRLGELHLMVEPVEPDPAIWQRIKAKLPEPPPGSLIALPEVVPEPELAPRPESGPEPHGELALEPEPQPSPEAQPQFQPAPAAEPKAEPEAGSKSASAAEPAFWPELERALLEAQSARDAGQSPPKEMEHTVLPPSEPATGEAQAVEAPSQAIEERPEPIEAPGRSTETVALQPSPDTSAPTKPAPPEQAAPPLVRPPERDEKTLRVLRRRLARWRAFTLLMMLAVLAVAALLALWKFAPERVPAALQPAELLQRIGVRIETAPGTRPSGLPEPQFEE